MTASNRLVEPLSAVLARYRGDWRPMLAKWRQSAAGQSLVAYVDDRVAAGAVVYPRNVLRALEATPLAATRAVLVGQDPYHGPGQAEGLAFSVPEGVRPPPSLRNLFRELARDIGIPPPANGSLQRWADQGVLLLNTVLTVEDGMPGAHAQRGWESLTDLIIAAAAADPRPKAFLLWGAQAQTKQALVEVGSQGAHLVLKSNHPSPLSASRGPQPFIGNGHFRRVRDFSAASGDRPILW